MFFFYVNCTKTSLNNNNKKNTTENTLLLVISSKRTIQGMTFKVIMVIRVSLGGMTFI